jgi:methyltransferase
MLVVGKHGMTATILILSLVTLQRAAELVWARRNTRLLLARGAVEIAPGHYPILVALHLGWLAGLWLLGWNRSPDPTWIALYAAVQAGRIWVLAALRDRWTTRIIVLAGASLVRDGPYRFFNHPNYAVVALEVALLPLAFGLSGYAVVFSVLNAGVLAVRISAENDALRAATAER